MKEWDGVIDTVLNEQVLKTGSIHMNSLIDIMIEKYHLDSDKAKKIVEEYTKEHWE
jgi:hypothetical protein